MMDLPIEISPNPLISSIVELRITTAIESQKLFQSVNKVVADFLPNFSTTNIPTELRKTNENLKYTPDFILSNDDFRLSFSNSVIVFENVAAYKLWNNYFSFICICLDSIFKLNVVGSIERIGVRYASVLDNANNIDLVLTSVPSFSIPQYEVKFDHYRANIKIDEINLLLQIFDRATAVRNGIQIAGVYIDIDASYTRSIKPDNEVLKLIDRLHGEQKKVFFRLLKKEFLETLNPRYK